MRSVCSGCRSHLVCAATDDRRIPLDHLAINRQLPQPPALDAHLWELMFGMLGLGALRTLEKLKGAAR
jgi:hypothetical protein